LSQQRPASGHAAAATSCIWPCGSSSSDCCTCVREGWCGGRTVDLRVIGLLTFRCWPPVLFIGRRWHRAGRPGPSSNLLMLLLLAYGSGLQAIQALTPWQTTQLTCTCDRVVEFCWGPDRQSVRPEVQLALAH
jgi:hypothetical protein